MLDLLFAFSLFAMLVFLVNVVIGLINPTLVGAVSKEKAVTQNISRAIIALFLCLIITDE